MKTIKPRELDVLTRESGVRQENRLLTDKKDRYFLQSSIRTPALRKEADELVRTKPAKSSKKLTR